MDTVNTFSERLKMLRTKAGMTQKQLAARLGVSTSQVSYYETAERSPSPERVVDLARIFHVTADYLLGLQKHENTLDISDLDEESCRMLIQLAQLLRDKSVSRK